MTRRKIVYINRFTHKQRKPFARVVHAQKDYACQSCGSTIHFGERYWRGDNMEIACLVCVPLDAEAAKETGCV